MTVIRMCLFLLLLMTACGASIETQDDPPNPTTTTLTIPASTPERATQPLATPVQEQQTMPPNPSAKIASSIQQRIMAIEHALASGTADVSGLSDNLLHVRQSGEIELVFHAVDSVGQAEETELEALGADIVASTASLTWPAGIQPPTGLGQIQAWLPYDRVNDAAWLPWITAITPPDYGVSD